MRKLYYRSMHQFTLWVAWLLFYVSPSNRSSAAWIEASWFYERKLHGR